MRIWLSRADPGAAWTDWLPARGSKPRAVQVDPQAAFNIIYSSGTTGTPKGVVHSYAMRWAQAQRKAMRLGADAVTILSTHFYSNLTLSMFFQSLSNGARVVLMPKFDPEGLLVLVERHRATHLFLVPTQYQRIMALPNFASFDLGSVLMKFCASAPFPAPLKADVVKRFPGELIEIYGMTEGGGMTMLDARKRQDELGTVGQPVPGHDFRILDESGRELPPGSAGEVAGRSNDMMSGYHNQPEKTKKAEWRDAQGRRFIRTGDVGWFDEEGFLTLVDRRKDMIIKGGLNIYCIDLEAALCASDAVADAAVVGSPSQEWGETPVGFVVLKKGSAATADQIRDFANRRLGKMQRIDAVHVIDALPRSPVGKVLKTELRKTLKPTELVGG